MKLIVTYLAIVLLAIPVLAANQPSMPPPGDWHGVRFGAKKSVALQQIRSNLKLVRSNEYFTTANVSIAGHNVEVDFEFDDSLGLHQLYYETPGIGYDETIAALTEKYGPPNVKISEPVMGTPISKWIWSDPYFEIKCAEFPDRTVVVVYTTIDPELARKAEQKLHETNVEKIKKSAGDF